MSAPAGRLRRLASSGGGHCDATDLNPINVRMPVVEGLPGCIPQWGEMWEASTFADVANTAERRIALGGL